MVQNYYTDSGLGVTEFAANLNADMAKNGSSPFRGPITPSHIKNMLLAFDIKPNMAKATPYGSKRNEQVQLIAARVSALEDQMARLTDFLRKRK
jgi:hypothetical protein